MLNSNVAYTCTTPEPSRRRTDIMGRLQFLTNRLLIWVTTNIAYGTSQQEKKREALVDCTHLPPTLFTPFVTATASKRGRRLSNSCRTRCACLINARSGLKASFNMGSLFNLFFLSPFYGVRRCIYRIRRAPGH